ncbi:hypothetical protein BZG36_00668 [Bifiguratus adelaidae]|uniref:Uncharacterized protein n=1 Tax=Bifiguratus adelaidae TaxID=1938954 RepID=A0A261Y732_9FUNG|nr:hypothetical protein BZG36_00668 [Bifiguratus adelaidae]
MFVKRSKQSLSKRRLLLLACPILLYLLFFRDRIKEFHLQTTSDSHQRVKAAFVVLARNSELQSLRLSIQKVEDRFNRKFNYPWIFLNDEPFSDEFKEYTSALTKSETRYGLVPKEHWSYPEWIDQGRAAEAREDYAERGIAYGGSESYRHMCRFEYYWRVEPDVNYYCDIDYDPFLMIKTSGKKYGFAISFKEWMETIPMLWDSVRSFRSLHPDYFPLSREESMEAFVTNEDWTEYNSCHFGPILRLLHWIYGDPKSIMTSLIILTKPVDFFMKGKLSHAAATNPKPDIRWGDAPIHSIWAALTLKPEEFHFFNDFGYRHSSYTHCPVQKELNKKCICEAALSMDNDWLSCLREFYDAGYPREL